MSTEAFKGATLKDREYYYPCKECGEMVDCRDLDEVWFHEDHKPHPDLMFEHGVRITGGQGRRGRQS